MAFFSPLHLNSCYSLSHSVCCGCALRQDRGLGGPQAGCQQGDVPSVSSRLTPPKALVNKYHGKTKLNCILSRQHTAPLLENTSMSHKREGPNVLFYNLFNSPLACALLYFSLALSTNVANQYKNVVAIFDECHKILLRRLYLRNSK